MERMETLSQALERLARAGYRDGFRAEAGGLRALEDGRLFEPEALVCEAMERFEGESDPADQTILFALRTPDRSVAGTLVAQFGPGVDPAAAEVIRRLPELQEPRS